MKHHNDRMIRLALMAACIGRAYHYRPRATDKYVDYLGQVPSNNPHRTRKIDRTKDARAIRRSERQRARREAMEELATPKEPAIESNVIETDCEQGIGDRWDGLG